MTLLVRILFLAAFFVRLAYVFHYRFDSDEPQHLHVVWGWTRGLVQYKDVFDNHMPLFHLVCAPVFKLVGERADALVWMRLAMVPLFFFCLWCVFRLGRVIHSPELGKWAALFVAVTPGFAFPSTEFRADDLWTAFWLFSLVILFEGEPTPRRGFLAGVLLGATLVTSLKTLALLGCLTAGTFVTLLICGRMRATFANRRTYGFLAALLAGIVVLPAIIALCLWRLDAWHQAIYDIFQYNNVPGLGRMRHQRDMVIGMLEFLACLGALVPLSRWLARRYFADEKRVLFHALFLGTGFYGALIYTLWPLLDAEHLIPFFALFTVGLMPLVMDGATWLGRRSPALSPTAVLAVCIAICLCVEGLKVRQDRTGITIAQSADLLKLSQPGDYVMDLKGETIFRRRPYDDIFEGVGIARARRHQLPDEIPEVMIRTGTCITTRDNYRYTFPRARAFLDRNYLEVGGQFRVLGHAMTPTAEPRCFQFDVVIPERFVFIAHGKAVRGAIDGKLCDGTAYLASGTHSFRPEEDDDGVDFVWERAFQQGFLPIRTASIH